MHKNNKATRTVKCSNGGGRNWYLSKTLLAFTALQVAESVPGTTMKQKDMAFILFFFFFLLLFCNRLSA